MTRILDLPTLGFDFTVGNNEDWRDSSPTYVDAAGAPIPLDGIAVTFVLRPTPTSPSAPVRGSTTGLIDGIATNGAVVVGGDANNIWAILVDRAVMLQVPAGIYAWEAQAVAEVTKTIGQGAVTIRQGIVR